MTSNQMLFWMWMHVLADFGFEIPIEYTPACITGKGDNHV